MRQIHIHYHRDGGSWWADSMDLPGWTAVGESIEEVRTLARAGAEEFAGEPVFLVESGDPGDQNRPRRTA
jgi:predicted RNase H-like HicB family nuclease